MILDKIENAEKYYGLSKLLDEGLKFIIENDFSQIAPGKFYLKEDQLYAIVSEYESKPEADCKLESHKKYIDIQYVASGEEKIGFTTYFDQKPTTPYNEEKDAAFYKEDVTFFTLSEGMFAIFMPDDLHQPSVQANGNSIVKKVVVKVLIK